MGLYKSMWKNTFNFVGLASREEFWTPTLINIGILALFMVLIPINLFVYEIVLLFFLLVIFLPELALTVRRLHDTDRSGLNALWQLIPLIGWIILVVFLTDKTNYNYDTKAKI